MFTVIFLFLISLPAFADSDCWSADRSHYDCSNTMSGGAAGASAPLLGDTLDSNPAELPVDSTPFGIELLGSDRSFPSKKKELSVSTVKGFDGIGFGLGSWKEGTFSAPDFPAHFLASSYLQEFKTYEEKPPQDYGLRIGSALLLPKGPLPKDIRLSIGGSIGTGQVKGDISTQVGALLRIYVLGLGYSQNFEKLSLSIPRVKISVFSVGLRLGRLYLGYNNNTIKSSVNRTFSNTFSLRINAGKWIYHLGYKAQRDHRQQMDRWARGGIQRKLGKHLVLGYEYGIYRDSNSALLQFLF